MNENNLRVAFLYNVRHIYPNPDSVAAQVNVDFDDPETVDFMIKHLEKCGFFVIAIEANEEAYLKLYEHKDEIDVVFNYSEGLHGRDREAHLPAMLEMLQLPYTGSAPLTQSIVLNKAVTKNVLKAGGVPVTETQIFKTGNEVLNPDMKFPLFVKPVSNGSSAGIKNNSVVHDEDELYAQVRFVIETFGQDAMVEPFLTGREFSVPMVGNPPRILPFIEPDFSLLPEGYNPIDSFEVKWIYEEAATRGDEGAQLHLKCPAQIPDDLRVKIERMCLQTWEILGVRDFCRIDTRCDAQGNPYVLEVNSPAGLIPPEVSTTSYLPLAARASGIDYDELLKTIIFSALKRYEN